MGKREGGELEQNSLTEAPVQRGQFMVSTELKCVLLDTRRATPGVFTRGQGIRTWVPYTSALTHHTIPTAPRRGTLKARITIGYLLTGLPKEWW